MHDGAWFIDDSCGTSRTIALLDRLLLRPEPAAYLSWSRSLTTDLVPLRRCAVKPSVRVKSYRRLAREGTLPPVLLWWVSGLMSYVILDGHDRFVAAIAEGVAPSFVTLSRFDPERRLHTERSVTRDYISLMSHLDAALAHSASLDDIHRAQEKAARHLAQQLTERTTHSSWFWPLAGGVAAWKAQAALADAAWYDYVCTDP